MKTAIVTGGSSGIGKGICELLLAEGFAVVFSYNTHQQSALELANRFEHATALKADLSDFNSAKAFVLEGIKILGRVDLLVNNAGISQFGLITDISEQQLDDILNINFKAVFACSQAVIPAMLSEQRGTIINIASMWGEVGASCEVAYSATKGAVIAFTKALAKELAPSHITVNAISPGVIESQMTAELSPETLDILKADTPLMRLGVPADIAKAILYLFEADFVTGQVLSVNGGMVI